MLRMRLKGVCNGSVVAICGPELKAVDLCVTLQTGGGGVMLLRRCRMPPNILHQH